MDPLITVAYIAAATTTLGTICALIVGMKNSSKLIDLHVAVNSRLSELLAITKKASYAEGRQEGVDSVPAAAAATSAAEAPLVLTSTTKTVISKQGAQDEKA
jgi:hypothetical protein